VTDDNSSSGVEDADIDTLVERISGLPSDWHMAGTLGAEVILAISETLRQRGLVGRLSAETGCGKSTLLLSHLSARHYCFAVGAGDDSLERVRQSPLLRQEKVEFVVGPSQLTLPKYQLRESLALALIDGAHGYPFPELDYYHLYPRVESGGILILDDIHIPTITHLYNVLREDPMWDHLLEVGTTAFFVRTDAPLFDPTADGWWLQPYNLRRFPDKENLERTLGEKWWEAISLPQVATTEFELGQATRIRLLEAELSESRAAVTRREGELAELRSELEHVRSDLDRARQEWETGRQSLALATAKVDAMLASRSWRVTAPMRAISMAARRTAMALSGAGNARSERD
jgi:hypothetical protein